MIHMIRSVATMVIFLFVFGTLHAHSAAVKERPSKPARASATPEAEQSAGEVNQDFGRMTLWQARKMVVTGFQTCSLGIVGDPGSFRFSFDSFEFDARSRWGKDFQHYKVDMKSLPQVSVKRGFGVYKLKDEAGKDFPVNHLAWQCQEPAESVAKAINHLRNMAGEQGLALRNLPQAAAAWRALSPKPELPEEVRAQRLLAETAFKEGKLGKALYHYENGVELYPVWPEGRFNAALMAAELKFYSEAVEHMRAYLELVPDSPDAPSARDQIVIWQDKATEKARESMQDQPQTPGPKRKK